MNKLVLTLLENLAARRSPSTYKIPYLVHMEDCRSIAHQGAIHGLFRMDPHSANPETFLGCWESIPGSSGELKTDLNFIRDELANLEDKI